MDEKKLLSSSSQDLLNSLDSNDEAEEIDESFQCCVCLDLLYKPIVLACGHISCFWCVHAAMSPLGESHCPICRCPYAHFPGICQLLHLLLAKMYPITYKGREKQVLEETERDLFSPELGNNLSSTDTCKESNFLDPASASSSIGSLGEDLTQYGGQKINTSTAMEQQNLDLAINEKTPTISGESHTGLETKKKFTVEENDLKDGTCELVSVNDVLCVACKQMLIKPSVLNCGHVYCQSCIATLADEAHRCQICQRIHPQGSLKVCLELDQFLEKRFPEEYALRKEAIQYQPLRGQQGSPSAGTEQDGKQSSGLSCPRNWSDIFRLYGPRSNVHIGIGCDYCGMYPIIGDRYKCKDCVEEVGFDVCGECYNTSSKLTGRFNQQHTPDHQFELIKFNMMQLVPEHFENSSIPVVSDDASEDLEDGLLSHVLPNELPDVQDGDSHDNS